MNDSRLNQNITAEVKIDGVARDPATIWSHHQDDPYPGGHRYEVVCTGPDVPSYFKDFPRVGDRKMEKGKAGFFLQWLTLAFPKPSAPARFEFVLNTIERVEISDSEVHVYGECSPFVH